MDYYNKCRNYSDNYYDNDHNDYNNHHNERKNCCIRRVEETFCCYPSYYNEDKKEEKKEEPTYYEGTFAFWPKKHCNKKETEERCNKNDKPRNRCCFCGLFGNRW